MAQILHVKATKARKNFFELIDRVAEGDLVVYIENSKTNSTVVLEKDDGIEKTPLSKKKKGSILDLYGSLGPLPFPYEENEMDLAHELHARDMMQKLKEQYE